MFLISSWRVSCINSVMFYWVVSVLNPIKYLNTSHNSINFVVFCTRFIQFKLSLNSNSLLSSSVLLLFQNQQRAEYFSAVRDYWDLRLFTIIIIVVSMFKILFRSYSVFRSLYHLVSFVSYLVRLLEISLIIWVFFTVYSDVVYN